VAGELLPEPIEPPAVPGPRAGEPMPAPTEFDGTGAFHTGTLFDELADPDGD